MIIAAVGLPCVIFIHERDGLTRLFGVVPVLTRAIAILSDLLVLVITWVKSADSWRKSLHIEAESRPKLLTLLIRDGKFTFMLSEQKLTRLRYSVLCVRIFSEAYLPRLANSCFKHSIGIE